MKIKEKPDVRDETQHLEKKCLVVSILVDWGRINQNEFTCRYTHMRRVELIRAHVNRLIPTALDVGWPG
jgi:hypothetical protein